MQFFDPNGAAIEDSGLFGLPTAMEDAKIAFIPVPWDATSSFKNGASSAPKAIFDASKYTELYDVDLGKPYEEGLAMDSLDTTDQLVQWNTEARILADPIIAKGGVIESGNTTEMKQQAAQVDMLSSKMHAHVYERVCSHLNEGKITAVIGGDHSVSFGAIRAYAERYKNIGVLQIDAHCDLRSSFEGFAYSHGSVMDNVLTQTKIGRLVQVGVRGFCEEEFLRIRNSSGRVRAFYDRDLANWKASGDNWNSISQRILDALPDTLYLTIDVDGLDPSLCPHTGTPVPGGLSYNELTLLLKTIAHSGKRIVGFDIVETVPGPEKLSWDAIVSAQLLYHTAGWCLQSQKYANEKDAMQMQEPLPVLQAK